MPVDPRPVIKAGSLTNLTDARYFASFGVEMIGFHFDPFSESYLPPQLAAEIRGWLYGPKFAGEFRGLSRSEQGESDFRSIVEQVKLDVVECRVEDLSLVLANWQGPVVVALNPEEASGDLSGLSHQQVEYIILQTEVSAPPVELIDQLSGIKPVLLDGNFDENSLPGLLEKVQPVGFNIRGGSEQKVGMKAFEKLDPLMIYLVGDPS